MKRVVALGALALVGVAASCDSDSGSSQQGGGRAEAGESGAGAEGGEGSGEQGGGPSGGRAGSGAGFAGSSGMGVGGRGGGGGGVGAGGGTGGVAGTAGASGAAGTGVSVPCGLYDCSRLPNVRPGAPVECRDGVCVIPPESCEAGFAHCTTNSSVGCETDIRTSENCGGCGLRCVGERPACSAAANGWQCFGTCQEPTPDYCGRCIDLDTDPFHCGTCDRSCLATHVAAECVDRQCVATGMCEGLFGDCNAEFGCETSLATPENCGACGRDCGAENATPECNSLGVCPSPTCNPGYGNCDRTSLDCEATFGGTCFPDYAGTYRIALPPAAAAVAPGGSFSLGGSWTSELDFDASLGVDRLTATYSDAYVTRYDANGAYAWTRVVASGDDYEGVTGLAMTQDGSIVATGFFHGTADLDPGPGVDEQAGAGLFVSKLSPSGNRDWVRVFRAINVEFSQHAVDASGAVYISGWFLGEIDLDPGPGEDLHDPISNWESGFLVKLDASGNFVWSKLVEGIDAQRMRGVSIAPDGTVWCFGTQPGSATLAGAPLSTGRGVFFASFDSAGTLGRTLALDVTAGADPPSRIAASTGAIHLGAQFWGDDLDPGAGRELRYASDPSAVLVSLDAIGTFRQAHLIAAYNPLPELAAAPAGGVLLGLQPGEVRAYYADGVSSWSLPIGDDFTLHRLASSTTHWIALGLEYGTADYDPGPGTATVYSNTLLVTRYAF